MAVKIASLMRLATAAARATATFNHPDPTGRTTKATRRQPSTQGYRIRPDPPPGFTVLFGHGVREGNPGMPCSLLFYWFFSLSSRAFRVSLSMIGSSSSSILIHTLMAARERRSGAVSQQVLKTLEVRWHIAVRRGDANTRID